MGRVWSFSRWSLAAVLALALLLVVALRGDNGPVEATTFTPALTVTRTTDAAGAHPDVSVATSIPQTGTDAFFSQFFNFFPSAVGTYSDAAISDGTVVGSVNFNTRLGLFNSQCLFPFSPSGPVTFIEGTTSRTNLVPYADTAIDGSPTDPSPGNGVEAGADGYPLRVAQVTPGGESSRWFASTVILGLQVDIHYLTYPAGGLGLPAGLGKPTLVFFNTSDVGVATPTIVTDSCPAFFASVTGLGNAGDNPSTAADESLAASQPGGSAFLLTNPGPGTILYTQLAQSERDSDNDGIGNSDDSCPYQPNVGSPYTPPISIDLASDGAEFNFFTNGILPDGIDAVCDLDPLSTCGPGIFDDLNLSLGAVDCDLDGFPNRGDNCPQVANASQLNSELLAAGVFYADGGPKEDDAGDVCDPNPGIPDGHYHQTLNILPVCITSAAPTGSPLPAGVPWFADSDGDGWCNISEAGLSSDLTNPASTPETLSVPTTCENGADDDGDGFADLADSGCQLPAHDIQLKKIKLQGNSIVTAGSTRTYRAQLLNNNAISPATEAVQFGVIVDPAFGAGCSGPTVSGVSGGTVTTSAAINIDGDTDAEWLLKVVASVSNITATNVFFDVTFPNCGAAAGTPLDYVILGDACHGNDVAPLGLFGAAACAASAASDGGQDQNLNGNDSSIPVAVDVTP